MEVHGRLGCGFLETVYENALAIELAKQHISFRCQPAAKVRYKGIVVGNFYPDIVVDDRLLLELKATKKLLAIDQAQLLNYLKVTGIQAGLLLNFGTKSLEIKRMVNGIDERCPV